MIGKELDALVERLQAEWQDDPNVSFVWLSHKVRGGRLVEGPTLCFAVRRKLASEEEIRAAGSRLIPSEIEGVQTDVVVMAGTGLYWAGSRGRRRMSPLAGGVSSAPLGSILPFPTRGGTLGGVCYYQDGREMALSNAHVWGFDLGCDIVQPIIPASQFGTATLELLTCGPLIAYLVELAVPSVLTTVLTTAAAAAWIAAAAADAKDPHRRGQEATVPAQPGELTQTETVHFVAAPETLPIPGLPYQAAVSWEYARQTDQAAYPFQVNETRANEHTLVRQHVWAQAPLYSAGQTAKIRAVLETAGLTRPDAFHVVVHLAAKGHPERSASRVLHPATCGEWPFLGVSLALGAPDTAAQFPLQHDGIVFQASQPGMFRDWWPRGNPDRLVALQFPDSGLTIQLPAQAERADLQVVQLDPASITLEAYDAQGTQLDSVTPPSRADVQHLLKVHGPGITRLVLSGGHDMGLLRWVSLKMSQDYRVDPLYRNTHVLCYEGQYAISQADPPGTWQGMLSAQSVNTLPPGTPPLQAAATLGGIESAILATTEAPCTICLALDPLFVVV